jgi:protein-tyrosine kinase
MNALPHFIKPQLAPVKPPARTIGDILVASGRLSVEDAARIIERQKKDQTQFGEAALSLKLLRKEDIDYALSKQFNYAYLSKKDSSLSRELVAAYQPFSRVGENLRAVRSQLMLRWFNADQKNKALALVSPGRKDGRSFMAANLAVVFAQHGESTLLIDGNLRNGRQQELFKLTRGPGLSGLLAGRATLHEATMNVPNLPGLSVLQAGALPPNPQELLGRPAFAALLREAAMDYDAVIIDTPAAAAFSDAEIIASRVGAAVVLARKNVSLLPATAAMAERLSQGGVALIGSVLNDV